MNKLIFLLFVTAAIGWSQQAGPCPTIPATNYSALDTFVNSKDCGLSGNGVPTSGWCDAAHVGLATYINTGTSPNDFYVCTALGWVIKAAAGPQGPTGPSGAGSGDVLGSATNSAGGIPTYNGVNSKTLAAGIPPTDKAVPIANGTTYVATQLSGAFTISNAGVATASTPSRTRTCVVTIGDPGAASPALADDNDSPVACGNTWGADWTITSVAAWSNAGTPTTTPILTGGSGTSILTGALSAGAAAWAAGTVQSTPPVVHSFNADGATCPSTPCTIDVNITTAGGTSKYLVVRISGTIP